MFDGHFSMFGEAWRGTVCGGYSSDRATPE
jgi:hypothetical protein